MPVTPSPDLFELYPEQNETLMKTSLLILEELDRLIQPGVLYKGQEIHHLLKRTGLNGVLVELGLPKLHYIDRRCTSVQRGLINLWRNGYLRKFARGIFAMSGRPYGVVWLSRNN